MNARRMAAAAGIFGLALSATPTAGAQPPPRDDIRKYRVATGNYTAPGDHGFAVSADHGELW
jgi:hypothetical protein